MSKMPHAWPAQSPPADFAERTVAALLREPAARRRSIGVRHWTAVLGIAAVLIAGAAGAWTIVDVARGTRRVKQTAPVIPSQRAPFAVTTSARPEEQRAAQPGPDPRPAHSVMPTGRKDIAPSHAVSAPLSPGRTVKVPRCNCQDSICDCGQEP